MNTEQMIEDILKIDLDFVMEDIMSIADTLDKNYQDKPANYHMKYIQLSHLDLKAILLADLINWLCTLGYSDGDFSIIEIEFIKRYLRLDLPSLEIIKFAQESLVSGFLDRLPESFALLMEDDRIMNLLAAKTGDTYRQDFANRLLVVYQVLGLHFILCDGKLDEDEKVVYFGFLGQIKEQMDDFSVDLASKYYQDKLRNELGIY